MERPLEITALVGLRESVCCQGMVNVPSDLPNVCLREGKLIVSVLFSIGFEWLMVTLSCKFPSVQFRGIPLYCLLLICYVFYLNFLFFEWLCIYPFMSTGPHCDALW